MADSQVKQQGSGTGVFFIGLASCLVETGVIMGGISRISLYILGGVMKHYKIFSGILALALVFGLALTGCPTELNGPSAEVKAAKQFANTLNALGSGTATVDGATVTLAKDVANAPAIPVPAGVMLVIPPSRTLDFGDGGVLKVDGTLNVAGTLSLGDTGTGISPESYLKGTINISGTLEDNRTGGGSFWPDASTSSTGELVFSTGATAKINGNPMIGPAGLFNIGANATFTMRAASNSKPTYEIAGGTVTVQSNGGVITHDQDLYVASGTLHINNNVTLTVNGQLNVAAGANVTGTTASTASKIKFGSGAYNGSSIGKAIFYTGGYTAGTAVAGKTYTWTANANGAGAEGWKVQ
jgi:hypothetical protein